MNKTSYGTSFTTTLALRGTVDSYKSAPPTHHIWDTLTLAFHTGK